MVVRDVQSAHESRTDHIRTALVSLETSDVNLYTRMSVPQCSTSSTYHIILVCLLFVPQVSSMLALLKILPRSDGML